jgi:hypothetical protein
MDGFRRAHFMASVTLFSSGLVCHGVAAPQHQPKPFDRGVMPKRISRYVIELRDAKGHPILVTAADWTTPSATWQ